MADKDLVLIKPINEFGLNKPFLVVGFPTAGLVGSVALTYFTQENDFELVGAFKNEKLAPVLAVHNYKILPPVRLMVSKSYNMAAIVGEITTPISLSSRISDTIIELYKKLNASLLIIISSVPKEQSNEKVRVIYSNKYVEDLYKDKGIGLKLKEGAATGIGASLVQEVSLRNINALMLLIPADPDIADPVASSKALKLLSKIINKPINTSKLDKEAKELLSSKPVTQDHDSFTPSMYR